jgi:hypothetical protein
LRTVHLVTKSVLVQALLQTDFGNGFNTGPFIVKAEFGALEEAKVCATIIMLDTELDTSQMTAKQDKTTQRTFHLEGSSHRLALASGGNSLLSQLSEGRAVDRVSDNGVSRSQNNHSGGRVLHGEEREVCRILRGIRLRFTVSVGVLAVRA